MHIQGNELGKNRTRMNGANDAASKVKQKGIGEAVWKNDRNKAAEESFQDSLQRSMNAEMTTDINAATDTAGKADAAGRTDSGMFPHTEPGFSKGKAERINIHVEWDKISQPAKEVAVRQIPYSECDRVEINILEGYTLKAKLETDKEGNLADRCHIYVEMKDEEGLIKACLFDGAELQENSHNAMERIAYAVMCEFV